MEDIDPCDRDFDRHRDKELENMTRTPCCHLEYRGENHNPVQNEICRHCGRGVVTDNRTKHVLLRGSRQNRSGFKGVAYSTAAKKWEARIRNGGAQACTSLGYFDDVKDAAKTYDKAAFKHWGHQCYLNFPDQLKGVAARRKIKEGGYEQD